MPGTLSKRTAPWSLLVGMAPEFKPALSTASKVQIPFFLHCRYTEGRMNNPSQPNVRLVNAPDYRETYANSVQVRVNVWDFFLVFGTLQQQSETQVEVKNFQGIYLSPQQAKALMSILQQNVSGYESTFGEIKLDPRMAAAGPVH
jgi:flagellar protein FlaG